jgi:hypothetical protein
VTKTVEKRRKKAKTAKKTAKATTPALVPQPGGRGALYAGGVPGNAGGGRPADELKKKFRELVSDDTRIQLLDTILRDSEHKLFSWAYETALEHGYGKATQTIAVLTEVQPRLDALAKYVRDTPLIPEEHRTQVISEMVEAWKAAK